jgi:hypothetical protein
MASNRSIDQLDQAPIFVVGAARSGTTWVYDVLTAHPQVAGVYESWLFTRRNGLKSLFTEAHWPPKASGLGRFIERKTLVAYARDMTERIIEHAIKPDHRFLVEKSPSHVYHLPFVNEIFPNARFIHVLRDGRDVSVSVRSAARSWVPAWRETFGRSIKSSALNWKNAVRRVRKHGKQLGNRFFEIRYEKLHKDPLNLYRGLFDFCQIPYDDELIQSVFDATDFKKNYSPHEDGFRRGGRVGDWRSRFSLKDAVVFNLAAGEMLVELGYEKDRLWLPNLYSGRFAYI